MILTEYNEEQHIKNEKNISYDDGFNDGKIEAIIKNVALSDGLIGWLMMLQTNVQVLLPLDLKEIIKKRLNLMLRMYEQDSE